MRRYAMLFAIMILALALRVHWLGRQELRGDEAFTWNYIQKDPAGIVAAIVREGDPQPPLHYWLQWGWGKLTGYSEFAMRAWSALLSLSLIPLLYQAGRRLCNRGVGLWAAALFAIHPQQIWLAQDVRNMYQLALIFLLTATLLLHQLVRGGAPAHKIIAGYILCGALAMYSHYYSLFFLIAHGALALSRPLPRSPAPLRSWLLSGLAIAALVAPWALVILPVYARGQLADPGNLSLMDYTLRSFSDAMAGPSLPQSHKLALTTALAILAIVPFLPAPSPTLLYLLAAIVIPFVGIYAITATRSTFNTFYFVFAAPALVLLPAYGLQLLRSRWRPAALAAALIIALGYGAALNNHYNNPDFSKTRGMRELAAALMAQARPGDIYLANAPDPAQVYYIRPTGLPFVLQPAALPLHPAQTNADLARLIAHRLWFVPVRTAQDPAGYVEERLLATALLANESTHGKMRLLLFLPPTEATPLAARFAAGVRLVGYHLQPNRLSLVWAADSPLPDDYTVFVHALAFDGYNLAGHDAPPAIPTTQWQPGQLIVDVHEFTFPADQPITLVAGLYLPRSGNRLPLETESSLEPDAAVVAVLP